MSAKKRWAGTTLAAAAPRMLLSAPLYAALLAPFAHDDGDYLSPTDDRVRVSLGGMHVSSSTTVRVDSSTGVPGTVLNAEDEFGLDKSDFEPKFEAIVRVSTRHRLIFDYFTLDRSGNAIVGAAPIVFRDVVLLPNDPLQTNLSLRTLGIAYGYSFWHSEKLELAATVGVQAAEISAMVKVQTQTTHIIQSEDQAGPVPTVGLTGTWVLSKRFYLDGRAQYLNVHVSNVGGSLGIYELNALYRFRPNVSFGLGYSDIRTRFNSTQSTKGGEFDFDTKGPQMFVRVAF